MNKLTPEIISWAQQGVVPAALKIAAAMEESGLGADIPPGSNNWFGIKGSGPATETREQTAGGVWYAIKAGFHMFKTPADGFAYYDWLISHGAPYAAAWKQWESSKKTDADVETLTRGVAAKYATALAYAKSLIALEEQDKLFAYDHPTAKADPVAPRLTVGSTKETDMNPFSFLTTFLPILESAASIVPEVITEFKALAQSQAVKDIESLIGQHLTSSVSATGQTAVIEPTTTK